MAQSTGAVEYTDCISTEGEDSPNECPRYYTKQSDGEAPVMLELWEMRSTPLLPSLSGPLWPGFVVPDRVISMGQIVLNCVIMLNWLFEIVFKQKKLYLWKVELFEIEVFLTFKLCTYAKLNC